MVFFEGVTVQHLTVINSKLSQPFLIFSTIFHENKDIKNSFKKTVNT